MKHLLYPILLLAGAALSGCATVAPYEREYLAESAMQITPDPIDAGYNDHIYFSIEGSSGGRSFGGGDAGATNMKKRDIKKQLSAAVATLLGSVPAAHAIDAAAPGPHIEGAVLYYSEGDGRVSAIEPVINMGYGVSGERRLNLQFTLDSLTGATPSGAAPSNAPQTFTRPTGNGSYVVNPGETPLDDSFKDTRTATDISWLQPLGRFSTLNLGFNYSTEVDFKSTGLNATITRDFNDKNTTLSLGGSYETDTIKPEGRIPVPFGIMAPTTGTQPRVGMTDDKTVVDAVLGLTQVVNPRTIVQVNYSLSRANGYLNDPYKILSVVDPVTANPARYLFENRPDSRTKHALYSLIRHRLKRDVVSADYRYFTDDWGVKSHTIGLSYRLQPSKRWWLEPLVRFYSQSEADFYRAQLLDGQPLPTDASADYRLAKFTGITIGLKHGWIFRNASELILKLEYYQTHGDDHPSDALASQSNLDFYPDLKSTVFQVEYRFK